MAITILHRYYHLLPKTVANKRLTAQSVKYKEIALSNCP